uniref:Uncharacterized protein n=1 Tax=Anguilla anguilla TaxID=7936 RepID=A0A0E9UYP9_ANGAN
MNEHSLVKRLHSQPVPALSCTLCSASLCSDRHMLLCFTLYESPVMCPL